MIARLIKASAILSGVLGLMLFTQQQAMAGDWLFKPSLDGGPHIWEYHHDDSDYSHLSNTAPAEPHPRNVPYSVTFYNRTNFEIAYGLNDQKEPRIKPGEAFRWTVWGSKENPAVFNIMFDNGQMKEIRYKLENGASFEFDNKGNGVDLYKRR